MEKLTLTDISPGVFWVEAPEAGVSLLCGCPEDSVKHLMQRGLIHSAEIDGVPCETGPNAILLSDVALQNGAFCNLAEFPVLQMLYMQGMILPDHPNNTGRKPLLIGSPEQLHAQMQYIYRGNYGLISKDEILATGATQEDADRIMRMKLKFAFGRIRKTEELLDCLEIEEAPVEIRNGVTITRTAINVFDISYAGETVTVDLNLGHRRRYRSPYPLGFQNIPREYFAVVHSGQGDGWDTNRPCMSSIIIYQGKIYLIDAGPNISYALTALGIDINEVEGIFHTHCHDDHFSGLTALIRTDHRVKYFATPLVRSSVFKKLAALLALDEKSIESYFDIEDLAFDEWNDIEGLEVRPVLSPHPVETSILTFRTFWEGRYVTYAHLADIASFEVMRGMVTESETDIGISQAEFDRVRHEYLAEVELKKIDIGGGMIHGNADDFEEDSSAKIVLAHQSQWLSPHQKEIGSSAPFGMIDILISDRPDNLRRFAFEFLRAYVPSMDRHLLRTLLNCPIVEFMPGSIVVKKGRVTENVYLLLTGISEKIGAEDDVYNIISAGGLIGEHSGIQGLRSRYTYRTVSFVVALSLPASLYVEIIKRADLYDKMEQLYVNRDFLERTWLFGESISPSVQARIAEAMTPSVLQAGTEPVAGLDPNSVYLVERGCIERLADGKVVEVVEPRNFFSEETIVFEETQQAEYRAAEETHLFEVPYSVLDDIPIVRWKLLESAEKRAN